jgi:hypothetical protein
MEESVSSFSGRAVAVSALAVVLAVGAVAVGVQLAGRSSSSVASPTPSAVPSAAAPSPSPSASPAVVEPLTVRFANGKRTLSATGATVEYPVVSASGGGPAAAKLVATSVEAQVNTMIAVFGTAAEYTETVPAERLFDTIGADSTSWGRYVSVVLDESTSLGGAHPSNRSVGLVFDATTGDRVQPGDVFTDLERASVLVREALVASRAGTEGPVSTQDVASVSLRPGDDGTTAPLTWYPTDKGLEVVVDQGSVVAYALGPIEATVPWAQLRSLLAPGATS